MHTVLTLDTKSVSIFNTAFIIRCILKKALHEVKKKE